MTTNKLDPPERMRELDAANALPPTETESFEYIQTLAESNRPLPVRRDGSGLFYWLLIFATFAFLSGAVFQASRAGAQTPAMATCIEALVEDVNPQLMSRQAATRTARGVCNGLRKMAPAFHRELTK